VTRSPDNDTENFMESLAGVRRLQHDRIDIHQNRPRIKHTVKHRTDFSEAPAATFGVTQHIPDSTRGSWFHHGLQKKLQRKIRMGQFTLDATLDLHGYRQHEALQELTLFLQYAINTQARLLLIIHGKGFRSQSESILRPLVQHWLSEQPEVLAYCPAQVKDGGNGASYVYLRS